MFVCGNGVFRVQFAGSLYCWLVVSLSRCLVVSLSRCLVVSFVSLARRLARAPACKDGGLQGRWLARTVACRLVRRTEKEEGIRVDWHVQSSSDAKDGPLLDALYSTCWII